jgi:hypothetical protein
MRNADLDRRRFLVAAVTLVGAAPGAFAPAGLRVGSAWAQGAALDPPTKEAMVRMARLLFPHNAIDDDVYSDVLDQALASTAADASFAETLRQAELALDGQGGRFVELDEPAQLAALRATERSAFFSAIQVTVRSRFYNHPAVWQHLGYGGPSYAQGGYLNRGAGEVGWLAEVD